MNFIKNGGSHINRLIEQKISESCNEIRLKGNYEIEETILLARQNDIADRARRQAALSNTVSGASVLTGLNENISKIRLRQRTLSFFK